MVCVPVRRDNPQTLANGLLAVQVNNPCSHLYHDIKCRLCSDVHVTGYLVLKISVSGHCGTIYFTLFYAIFLLLYTE